MEKGVRKIPVDKSVLFNYLISSPDRTAWISALGKGSGWLKKRGFL
jgi:hypothetical protein